MRLLLDTHAFLWWLTSSERLSRSARGAIADDANDTLVSAASAWEIATKHRLGKLPEAGAAVPDIAGAIVGQGFSEMAIAVSDGALAGGAAGPPPGSVRQDTHRAGLGAEPRSCLERRAFRSIRRSPALVRRLAGAHGAGSRGPYAGEDAGAPRK